MRKLIMNNRKKKNKNEYYFGSGCIKTLCKCPSCEKLYHRLINWTGRGIPRIYCEYCRNLKSISSDCEEFKVHNQGNSNRNE